MITVELSEAPAAETALLQAQPIEVYPGAQAVSRAIALLKAFSDAEPEWELADLSRRIGLNKATAHRILAALESEQFLVRNGRTGAYRLGPELIALGGCAMRSNDLRSVARPILEALADQTGESTTLEVLVDRDVLILDEVSSRHLVGMSQDVGARLPAHATSTGKLLWAYQPAVVIARLLKSPLPAITTATVTNAALMRQQLEQIREQGTAQADGELEIGFAAVAAPIFDHTAGVVAAISVGGPSLRLAAERLQQISVATQLAARQISAQLGYRTPRAQA